MGSGTCSVEGCPGHIRISLAQEEGGEVAVPRALDAHVAASEIKEAVWLLGSPGGSVLS